MLKGLVSAVVIGLALGVCASARANTLRFTFAGGPGGGFSTTTYSVNVFGDPVYTGSDAAPVFAPGRYDLLVSSGDYAGTLKITTVVPEPASWALMLAGFGGLGGALRASRKSATAA